MTAPGTPDVLVVDDNPGFLRVMRTVLTTGTPSFAVHAVATGGDALGFLARAGRFADAPRPTFVVLDFHLPDMDAPDVLAAMRRREDVRDIPVLVLTQADWAEDEAAARVAGSRAFCAKPSVLDELHHIVVQFWRGLEGHAGAVGDG
jgi:CheY-like chemotaxis protein